MAIELRTRLRRAGAGALAAAALTLTMSPADAAATPTAPATEATASASLQTVSTCWSGGKRLKHFAVKAGSRTVGYVNVYRYSGKSKCAQFIHAGAAKGKARYTTIRVVAGSLSLYNGGTTTQKSVGIKALGYTCITARGTINWSGKTRSRSVRACSS
ncbi:MULTISPECIES: hypothetical protein [Thermocrispum]|nr:MULTISPECIES: hypothetical protein [Thermocrispum]